MTGRWAANLATLANALVGLGAIAYTLAGNPLWGMLLIVCGLGFDGLDGYLSRRSGLPPSAFGRVADSVADAVTFGLAPAALVIVHTERAALWAPWQSDAVIVGVLIAALAFARLVYFTLRAFRVPHFVGAPTPQNALAVAALVLFLDVPGFLGTDPIAFLLGSGLVALTMVVPVPFPKVRRGSRVRLPATVTSVALVVALVPLQFRPAPGSWPFLVAEAAAVVAAAGIAFYYLAGPFLVPRGGTAVSE